LPDPDLKLKWRHTWPDADNDFVAIDRRMAHDGIVGRIYIFTDGPSKHQWFWSLTASGRMVRRPSEDRGYCNSPREAAAKVEAAWFKAVDDIAMDAPEGSIR
jgi:hypothetical protein